MSIVAMMVGRVVKWAAYAPRVVCLVMIVGGFPTFRSIVELDGTGFGTAADEAKSAGLTRQSLPVFARPCSEKQVDRSNFVRMDRGLLVKPAGGAAHPKGILDGARLTRLTREQGHETELCGQIAWVAWTGGDDRFWNFAASNIAVAFDLLKKAPSYKGTAHERQAAVRDTGLIDTVVGPSKCLDDTVNCGHDFGATLSADDKEALLTHIKHF